MEHPLPPRPSFLPSNPATAGPSRLSVSSLPPAPAAPSSAQVTTHASGAETTPSNLCSTCAEEAKYTCPRCAARSCSLACTKAHKSREGCSGVRDPTSFVSLKEYGQGIWSDDYTWLEQGRRKAGQWGQDIKPDELASGKDRDRNAGRPGRPGARNDARGKRGKKGGKMDGLRRQLERLGCEVDFMPEGMARRRGNQSSWNPKSQQLHLTVHLSVPNHLLDAASSASQSTPKTINHQRVLFASAKSSSDATPALASLLPASTTDTTVTDDLVFLLPFHSTPSRPAPDHQPSQRLFYPPLDPAKPLSQVLRGTSWVEFPIIEVRGRTEWDEGVANGDYGVVPLADVTACTGAGVGGRDSGWGKRKAALGAEVEDGGAGEGGGEMKKARVDPGEGLMALGDYASDDESEGEDDDVDAEVVEDADEPDGEGDEDPPIEVLRAVGMALAADMGDV